MIDKLKQWFPHLTDIKSYTNADLFLQALFIMFAVIGAVYAFFS